MTAPGTGHPVGPALSDWPRSQPLQAPPGAAWATPCEATPLPNPRWLHFNPGLAAELGLPAGWSGQAQALAVLAGQARWPGQAPSASVYGGHQFGRWVPQLGDGRALLIAELHDRHGQPQQLQLKGSGPTPYARGGDGRATWAASLRELLACEALHALGVPTTRALALVGSDLPIARDTANGQPEHAAVLCRSAPSFLRFGHLQHFAQAPAVLAELVALLLRVHFPAQAALADPGERLLAWLDEVLARTAALIAHWQSLGFCHGVMNTDNMSLLGLTLDYGPYGFMDRFRAHHIANSSDHEGRYAWTAQPAVGRWNAVQLLQACHSLWPGARADWPRHSEALLTRYDQHYHHAVMARWRAKLGLLHAQADDAALLNRLLTLMQASRCDYTLTFRALAQPTLSLRERFAQPAALDAWLADWQARLAQEGQTDAAAAQARASRMQRVNPLFVLRNHLAERAIRAAAHRDLGPLQSLLRVLSRPFTAQPGMDAWARPPRPHEVVADISCSA